MIKKELTNNEAEILIRSEKYPKNSQLTNLQYPIDGGVVQIDCIDSNNNEYIIGLRQKKIELIKRSYNLRFMTSITLLRIDYDREHRNPDGTLVGVPHIHIYKSGFNDKFAYSLQEVGIIIEDVSNLKELINKFFAYINVQKIIINTNHQMDLLTYE